MDTNAAHLSRDHPSDITSDSDLSKRSLSPRSGYTRAGRGDIYGKITLSPHRQVTAKSYRKPRSNSTSRVTADSNLCNTRDYIMSSYNLSDYRRTPAGYIEQDTINKERQQVQFLMEELGNRDQELSDLVNSHTKQIKAYEGDRDKLMALQARVSRYEDELRARDNQLKETLSEMSRINEQREVDANELKQTQTEMMKLAERIMENSLYIKEMEEQNQRLSVSVREYIGARQQFTMREQELLARLEEKDSCLAEKNRDIEKLVDRNKFLECQCEELGERNNNMTVESINWKKKYFQIKEEADKINAECKIKDENNQKMTQQLHESLQQAIALQKALFTSCEREKCKEEVMYSLRKQHKRAVQELNNFRELYDRLYRDTTLYHLSVKDKDSSKKEETTDSRIKRFKDSSLRLEDGDKRNVDGNKRKHDSNMSSYKAKPVDEQGFLVKEAKDRNVSKDEKAAEKITGSMRPADKTLARPGDKYAGSSELKNYKARVEAAEKRHSDDEDSISHVGSPRFSHRAGAKQMKSEQSPSGVVRPVHHTTRYRNAATVTSSTTMFSEDAFHRGANRLTTRRKRSSDAKGTCNTSRNADHRSLSNSRISNSKSVQSQTSSPNLKCESRNLPGKPAADKDSSSEVSQPASPFRVEEELTPADSDGLCCVFKKDVSRGDSVSPRKEKSGLELRRSKTPSKLSLTAPRKSSFLRKDRAENNPSYILDEDSACTRQRKRAVEFDKEDLTKSASVETHSKYTGLDSESDSPPLANKKSPALTRGNLHIHTNTGPGPGAQVLTRNRDHRVSVSKGSSPDGRFQQTDKLKTPSQGRYQPPSDYDSSQEVETSGNNCYTNVSKAQTQNCHLQGAEKNFTEFCFQCQSRGFDFCSCQTAKQTCTKTAVELNELWQRREGRYSNYRDLSQPITKPSKGLDSPAELSSASKHQSHQYPTKDKDTLNMCDTRCVDELKFSSPQQYHAKCLPDSVNNDPNRDQIYREDLTDKVSSYLAKHLVNKRQTYNNNNNNNSSTLHGSEPMNFDPYLLEGALDKDNVCLSQGLSIEVKLDKTFNMKLGDSYLQEILTLQTNMQDLLTYGVVSGKSPTSGNTCQLKVVREFLNGDEMGTHVSQLTQRSQGHTSTCLGESEKSLDKEAQKNLKEDRVSHLFSVHESDKACKKVVLDASDCWSVTHKQIEDVRTNQIEGVIKNFQSNSLSSAVEDCAQGCHAPISATDIISTPPTIIFTPPTIISTQPTIISTQPTIISTQPTIISTQPTIISTQLTIISTQPTIISTQQTIYSTQSTITSATINSTSSLSSVLASSCSSLVSCSTNLPVKGISLYQHLAKIHFSEKTRRYEWTIQPVFPVSSRQLRPHLTSNLQNRRKSPEHALVRTLDPVSSKASTESILNLKDNRQSSQSSDSGHFSFSGETCCHGSDLPRTVVFSSCREERKDCVDLSDKICVEDSQPNGKIVHSWSENKQASRMNDLPMPHKLYEHSFDANSNNSNNKIKDGDYYDTSFFPLLDSSSSSSYRFDPVVRRLDFNDSALEEEVESRHEHLPKSYCSKELQQSCCPKELHKDLQQNCCHKDIQQYCCHSDWAAGAGSLCSCQKCDSTFDGRNCTDLISPQAHSVHDNGTRMEPVSPYNVRVINNCTDTVSPQERVHGSRKCIDPDSSRINHIHDSRKCTESLSPQAHLVYNSISCCEENTVDNASFLEEVSSCSEFEPAHSKIQNVSQDWHSKGQVSGYFPWLVSKETEEEEKETLSTRCSLFGARELGDCQGVKEADVVACVNLSGMSSVADDGEKHFVDRDSRLSLVCSVHADPTCQPDRVSTLQHPPPTQTEGRTTRNEIKIFDPGTSSFTCNSNQEVVSATSLSLGSPVYSLSGRSFGSVSGFGLVDTGSGQVHTIQTSYDTLAVSEWRTCEKLCEETISQSNNTLTAVRKDSTRDGEHKFDGEATVSAMSRLGQLLVESQKMVEFLQHSSTRGTD